MSGWWLVASVRVSAHLPRVLTVRRAEDARQSEVRKLDLVRARLRLRLRHRLRFRDRVRVRVRVRVRLRVTVSGQGSGQGLVGKLNRAIGAEQQVALTLTLNLTLTLSLTLTLTLTAIGAKDEG